MADGKREHEYDVAISLACYVNNSLSGTFKPDSANPVRNQQREAVPASPVETKEAWDLVKAGLTMYAEGRGKDG